MRIERRQRCSPPNVKVDSRPGERFARRADGALLPRHCQINALLVVAESSVPLNAVSAHDSPFVDTRRFRRWMPVVLFVNSRTLLFSCRATRSDARHPRAPIRCVRRNRLAGGPAFSGPLRIRGRETCRPLRRGFDPSKLGTRATRSDLSLPTQGALL